VESYNENCRISWYKILHQGTDGLWGKNAKFYNFTSEFTVVVVIPK